MRGLGLVVVWKLFVDVRAGDVDAYAGRYEAWNRLPSSFRDLALHRYLGLRVRADDDPRDLPLPALHLAHGPLYPFHAAPAAGLPRVPQLQGA